MVLAQLIAVSDGDQLIVGYSIVGTIGYSIVGHSLVRDSSAIGYLALCYLAIRC